MADALPTSVAIREIGARDGFQNEPETVAIADKVRLIDALARTGLRRLEVTSFVRPDVIPQLADRPGYRPPRPRERPRRSEDRQHRWWRDRVR